MTINPPDASQLERQTATRVRWQLVVILMCFAAINHFHRQSLPSVVDRVMHDCQFDEEMMGWIYSSFLLGYVLFMIPGGWLADRLGGKLALAISGFATAAMVAATGYCGYGMTVALLFPAFLVVRFIMGVFTTALFPAAGRIVSTWIPFHSRAWANGLVLGATTIGVSTAPIVFGALADSFGWPNAFVIMGALTGLLTLLWVVYGRNRPQEHPRVNAAELAAIGTAAHLLTSRPKAIELFRLFRNRSLMLLTLNYAAVGYYEYTLFYWMKYYFKNVTNYTEHESRYFTSIVSLAMVFAMPVGGILSDRLVKSIGYRAGRMLVPIIGMAASAVLLFLATRMPTQMTVVGFFFLAHAAIGLCEAPIWVAGLEIGGEQCGSASAIVNMGGNFGGLLAPVITARVAKWYGWNAGFLIASGVCAIGVLLWFGIRLENSSKESRQ